MSIWMATSPAIMTSRIPTDNSPVSYVDDVYCVGSDGDPGGLYNGNLEIYYGYNSPVPNYDELITNSHYAVDFYYVHYDDATYSYGSSPNLGGDGGYACSVNPDGDVGYYYGWGVTRSCGRKDLSGHQ